MQTFENDWRSRWSASHDQRVAEMVAEGKTATEIAAELEYSGAQIRNHLRRLGLKAAVRKNYACDYDSILPQLHAKGLSPAEMSRRLGVTSDVVRAHMRRLGLYTPRKVQSRPWTQDEVTQIRKLRAQGLSLSTIGTKLRRGEHSVRLKLYEMRAQEAEAKAEAPPKYIPRHETPTAAIMGDPTPERSALGRKVMPHEYASKGGEGRFQSYNDGLNAVGVRL